MKTFTLTILIFLQSLVCFAQRDPSREILIFFKEGVTLITKPVNGKLVKTATIKSNELKTKLQKAGIEESMLEIAMPRFKQADT